MEKGQETMVWRRGIAEAVVVMVGAVNLLAYGVGWGIGWGMVLAIGVGTMWGLIPTQKRRPWMAGVAILGGISGLLIGLRANGFVQGYNFLVAAGCGLILLLAVVVERVEWLAERIIGYGWEIVREAWSHTGKLMAYLGGSGKDNTSKLVPAMKIAVISGVLLVVFGAILAAADPNFGQALGKIFGQIKGRIVISTLVTGVTVWWLTLALESGTHGEKWMQWIKFYELVVPIGAVGVLVGVFLAFQTNYLFASHGSFARFPESYSEYVRKGFFELMLAAGLGGSLSYGVWLLTQKTDEPQAKKVAVAVNGIWIGEIFLLLASAWWRDQLYIQAYGLTRTRLIGEGFLVWLAGIIGVLAVMIGARRAKGGWLTAAIGVMTIVLSGYFNLINMDGRIAQHSPIRKQQKDLFYIANLSEDTKGDWKNIIEESERVVESLEAKPVLDDNDRVSLASVFLAMRTLHDKFTLLGYKYYEGKFDLRNLNVSQYLAYLQISADQGLYFARVDNLYIRKIPEFLQQRNESIVKEENWILRDFDYPFVNVRGRD